VSRHVYALGGDEGDAGTALDSLEVAPNDLYGESLSSDLSAVTLACEPVDGAGGYRLCRTQAADATSGSEAWLADLTDPDLYSLVAAVDSTQHSVVDEETRWVYVLAGDDENEAVGDVHAGQVVSRGDLDDWQDMKSLSPGRAGFAVASASDFLYAVGGQSGEPSATGVSAELDVDDRPDVRN
jgi:hypothetical protein